MQLSVLSNSSAKTMSSREIAELVDSRHDKVKQSIGRLVAKGVIGAPPVGDYLDSLGRAAGEYHLDKRSSLIVVAQLCPEFTARIVDRWQELENAVPVPVALSRMDILLLAMDSEKRAIEAEGQLLLAAPKVAFVEAYVESTGLKSFREVAKLLKVKEPILREFLIEEDIMYQIGGTWYAYQRHTDAGRFEVKTGASKANGHAFNSTKFTPKGVEWFASEWAKHEVRLAIEA